MTPSPQERVQPQASIPPQNDGNRIVISGMSGLYPQAHNVMEFSDILYNKVNPVTTESLRFKYNHPEVVQKTGTVPGIAAFDAQFFKVHYRLANSMDPMARKVLEQAYQAIYDAGINPDELSGKKVGVYIGSCFSEAEKACFYEVSSRSGFGIAGCSKSMFANRISYWLNAKGPSMAIDEACCSSTAALEQAYLALSRGECEAAIVGGTYLCLHPQSSVHYGRIIKLCTDGKTKSFDENSDGCAKSEAINVLFLQQAKYAKRIYAEVLHAQTKFTGVLETETGPKYGFYRDLQSITNFMKEFYKEAGIPPHVVEYVEAFGCALPEVDQVELQAIEDVFCKNRDNPLLIGSVMSNIGYGEAASGISAITKVLLGFHYGKLAANLHLDQPRKGVPALNDGQMRIVNQHEEFGRSYVAVNGIAVTGVNSHVLLNGCYKPKNLDRYKSSIHHLVTLSGRHEEAVKHALSELKSNPIDPEQLALLHNIHRMSITGHLGRGFTILGTDNDQKTVSLSEKCDYFDDLRRPLWFVYSGMGSQWAGMGLQLMRIPIFAAAIERCRKALEPTGLDIVEIITTNDETIFNNILHSFVGIAAVQIGLTDIIHELGLKPDGIIGHSVGELGCAYADGCLTAEEMILSAYYRGLVSVQTKFIHGSMAAVGMGYTEVVKICPPEIEVACHNGPESSTISGPSDIMKEFVATLTGKGIFAKEVPCSNIAYHSRYIADAGPGLLKYLQQAIKNPKARSARWLSTSVPQDKWDQPIAKLCSAEYLTNNLLNSVLFEETSRLMPNNAVLVEIAPHGLLQAILKRSMPASCNNIPLTRRKHPDNTIMLLEAIGKLYMQGYNCAVEALYPKVEMPVSTGTPLLSHFVKWEHGEKWPIPIFLSANRKTALSTNFVISLHDKEYAHLEGHTIRGNMLYPFAASLTLVWDLMAMFMKVPKKQFSVTFGQLKLYSQPILHSRRQLKLTITIQRGTGYFEVLDEENMKVVTGFIKPLDENTIGLDADVINDQSNNTYLHTDDVYQLLRDRDYFYSGEFQSISSIDKSLSDANILWRDNWTTFIDGIIQLNAIRQPHDAVSQLTNIHQLVIDVNAHNKAILESNSNGELRAKVCDRDSTTRCGGVLMKSLQFQQLPPYNTEMSLKSLKFVSQINSGLDISSSLEAYLQIIAENLNKNTLTAVGIRNDENAGLIFKNLKDVINNIFDTKVSYKEISKETALKNYKFEDVDLILIENLSADENVCKRLQEVLPRDIFIINEEHVANSGYAAASTIYRVISVHSKNDQIKLELVRWGPATSLPATTSVSVRKESDFGFLTSVRNNLKPGHHLLVVASYPAPNGLKELVSSWRKETVQNQINLITVDSDYLEDNFSTLPLAFNNVTHGKWGGEYFLSMNQNTKRSQNVKLQGAQFGDYDSLKWVEVPEVTGSGLTVNVHYAGINYSDVKKANGSLLFKKDVSDGYGMDFSGVTESGKRIMGIVPSSAASTQIKAQPNLLWPVPAHWSLEDAATVPLAYVQAFYCLAIRVQLSQGKSVFIHGGAGALGQALISIALALDCDVYTTVSDLRKKHYLQKIFPALKADHIGCSRDYTFENMVKNERRYCDVVVSCVKGKLKDVTFDLTAPAGLFLDISQIQNGEDYNFGMFFLNKERNYISVDFSVIFEARHAHELAKIHKMVSDGIAKGYVRPLSRVTYAPHEVSRAFQLLDASRHRGRVLLRMNENTVQAQYRLRCRSDRSNLVVCGKTAFGVQFADRLVTRGTKLLYLNVAARTPYLEEKIRVWQNLGVHVIVSSEPLHNQNAVVSLLTSSLRLDPLEGVYVVVEETDTDHNFISNLDAEVRKLYSDLSHFAVIHFGETSTGKNVCLNRLRDQLPATVLMLPAIKSASHRGYTNWRGAIDALERALQSDHGVTLAHEERLKPSLLQQIGKLAGIRLPVNAEQNLTLEELGIQNHKVKLLSTYLQVEHNLTFSEEQIQSLTISKLMELEKKIKNFPIEDVKGLSTFLNYIDPDELLATTEIVFLPTLFTRTAMRDDEFEMDQIHLCIVPGTEGHHVRFRTLCERLKLPALVLQPGLDHPHETFTQTAQRFAKDLLNKTAMRDRFYLLGYETGIYVALEIAAILEENGLTGTVFCVGCTPEEFQYELEDQLSSFKTDEELQDGVLRHMYTLMTGDDSTVLDDVLPNLNTWSEKVEVCVRTLLGRVSHSAQYARAHIDYALARLNHIRNYKISLRPIRSQVILIRAAVSTSVQQSVLQNVSEQPLIVHQLSSPLAQVAADLRCSAIINKHLDSSILDEYSTKNLCETYLVNANAFMAVV